MKEEIKYTPAQEMLLTVKAWIDFAIKRWVTLLIISIVGGVLGFLYASYKKPSYKSKLTFALDEGGSGSMSSAMSLAAQFGLSIGGNNDIFGGDNIVEILKSRRAVESALLSLDTLKNGKVETLAHQYIKISDWKNKYSSKPAIRDVDFPVGVTKTALSYIQDSALFIMYEKIEKEFLDASRPDKRLNMFELSFISTDERFTKVFTDRLIDFSSTFYTEIKTKKSLQTLEALESRVNANKGMMNSSITSRAATQDANVNPAFAMAQAQQQKQQLNIQAYGGAYGELYKNLELARFQFLKATPLLQVIDAADYPMKKIKLSRLWTAVLGSVLGFMFSILFLAFRNFYRQTV